MRWPTEPPYPVTRGVAGHLADGQAEAVDIAAPAWTPLYPVHAGVVRLRFTDAEAGNAVDYEWWDDEGHHYIRYAHLIEQARFGSGVVVTEDILLGYVGSSGLSTGPHLHLAEFLNDERVDPEKHSLKGDDMADGTVIDALNLIWEKLSAIQGIGSKPASQIFDGDARTIVALAEEAKQDGVVALKRIIGLQ